MNRHRQALLPLVSLLLVGAALAAAETIDVPLANGGIRQLVVNETQVVVRSAGGATTVGIAGLTPAAITTAQTVGTVLLQARDSSAPAASASYLMGTTLLVQVGAGVTAAQIATRHGLVVDQAMNLPGYFVLSAPDPLTAVRALRALQADAQVLSAAPNLEVPVKPLGTDDRSQQWHLPLISITGAWAFGFTGTGINIAIVDTGIEATHPRLSNTQGGLGANYIGGSNPGPTWQFTDHTNPTTGVIESDPEAHGTFVAGLAAGKDNLANGVVGVAPGANLASVKVFNINGNTNDFALAQGLSHNITPAAVADRTDVSNNSWGSVLTASEVDPLGSIYKTALVNGVTNGRGNLGIPYVFASGNSGDITSCDYSGLATNPYVISVGALNEGNTKATYSEAGANVFLCAPVGDPLGSGKGSVSTDRVGKNGFVVLDSTVSVPAGDYSAQSDKEYGTSFAAPQVAGVAALILNADPTLTWRDVRSIFAATANASFIPDSAGWVTNGAGFHFNNKYGFGCVNAQAAVLSAQTWIKVPAESAPQSITTTPATPLPIPDGTSSGATIEFQVNLTGDFTVESVEFTPSLSHSRRGDISYSLRSAMGTTITVPGRTGDIGSATTFTFCTVGMWHERANGLWQLTVTDNVPGTTGTFSTATIVLHGFAGTTGGGGGGGTGSVGGAPGSAIPATGGTSSVGPANFTNDSSGGSCGAGSSLSLILMLGWLGAIALVIRRR